ncbi:MAG: Rieske (2Fe-2S) protein [Acidimicrobiia bacterium]|nr:Rieske (2Fe-2S) protein [Acidimicrobiia bacterium]MCY4432653.1 Rieske 2Fe-2S domain-containing protein [bacterium]
MPDRRMVPANAPLPSPFPEGWYYVASRRSLKKAKLIKQTWMGEDIIVWCDDNGRVCVSEAYCPHLGADLGPDGGACVSGGRLVCPFHGFEYDAGGQCVATPFDPPPKAARLRVFETTEIAGLIFAWWGIGGRPPQWNLPEEALDQVGWSNLNFWTSRFPGHPQDTTENSVDLAHLRHVHGYDNVSRVEPLEVDGHFLRSRFDFATTRRIAKVGRLRLNVSANTLIYGLGYSYVEVRERSIGLDMRLWILATPVDGTHIDLAVVSQVGPIRNPNRRIAGATFLPPRMRAPIVNKFMAYFEKRDVLQDVPIWSRKQYRSRPRLSRSDGEIMKYRTYCAQFYPDLLAVVEDIKRVADQPAVND